MESVAPPAAPRCPDGVPCVPVGDLAKAAAYYERFFELRPRSVRADGARLAGHGAQVELCPTSSQQAAGPRELAGPPAAVLPVDRPAVLRRRLDDLGAHLVEPTGIDPTGIGAAGIGAAGVTPAVNGPGGFGVRDCYGNVLLFVPAPGPGSLIGAVADRADRARRWLARAVDRWRDHRAARRLRRIARALPMRPGAVLLHAGRGLLHWLATTERHLAAAGADVVVLGSDLTAAERRWIIEHLDRPLHHVARPLDDAGALELLFAGARADFTWVELGCLVLEAGVLRDLASAPPGAALTCAWSYDSGFGFRVAAPYLLHVDAAALHRVRGCVPGITPGVYAWERFNRQVERRRCYTRTPARRVRRALAAVAPTGQDGRPKVPAGLPFFDTTVAYQLAARSCGLRTDPVRALDALGNSRGSTVQDEFSDELVYIGALTYADPLEEFSGYFHDDQVRLLHLLAEHVALAPVAATLPPHYGERLHALEEALRARGLDPADVPGIVVDHLVEVRGLGRAAAETAVRGRPDGAVTPPGVDRRQG